jgi:hypothetical protein
MNQDFPSSLLNNYIAPKGKIRALARLNETRAGLAAYDIE